MAVTKLNIATEPPSLAYRLVDDPLNLCARVEWEVTPTSHTAAELLRGPSDDDERTQRDEAVEWLHAYLTDNGGEAPAGDLIRDADKAGINKRTLQRARKRAGVQTHKAAFGGGWSWTLRVNERDSDSREGAQDDSPRSLSPSAPSLSPSAERGTVRTLGLGNLPGCCPGCDFHTETQGHRANCTERRTA